MYCLFYYFLIFSLLELHFFDILLESFYSIFLCSEQDQSINISGSNIPVGSGSRLMTPRSSGGYAFGSMGDSDEEGTELATEQDILFTYEDNNALAEYVNVSVCIVIFLCDNL